LSSTSRLSKIFFPSKKNYNNIIIIIIIIIEVSMPARPYTICHMITSIDGKILTARWKGLPASKTISGLYEKAHASYDVGAWLVGTNTMKEFCKSNTRLPAAKKAVPAGDFLANPDAETHAIGLDAHGVLRFETDEIGGDHMVVIITEKVGDAYRAHLRDKGISYLVCGASKVDLKLAMEKLRSKLKLKKVMLEGGGVLNGAMLQAELIDEISHIIAPIVDGGGPEVTGLFDPPGKASARGAAGLKLIAHESLRGGAQWLRFKVQ
jgi:2,5-diamino-6-(ribosylamino)-4(3H)-pyrimidinone 5'-phosphate reductase